MYRMMLVVAAVVCMGSGGHHRQQAADLIIIATFSDGTQLHIRTHMNAAGIQAGVGNLNNPGLARERLTNITGSAVIGSTATLSGTIEGVGTFTLTATAPNTVTMTCTELTGPLAGVTWTPVTSTATVTFQ